MENLVSTLEAMEQSGFSPMQWRYWRDKSHVKHVKSYGNSKFFTQESVDKVIKNFNLSKVI